MSARLVLGVAALVVAAGVSAQEPAGARWKGASVPAGLERWLDVLDRWSSASAEQRDFILADLRYAGESARDGLAAAAARAAADLDAGPAAPARVAAAARARLLSLRRAVRDALERLPSGAAPDRTRGPGRDLVEALEELDALVRSPASWALARDRGLGPLVSLLPAAAEIRDRLEGGAAHAGEWEARLRVLADAVPRDEVVRHREVQPFAAENARTRAENERPVEGLDDVERNVIAAANDYREAMGLRILRIDPRLVAAARKHSEEMERDGYFSHKSPARGRETVEKRAALEGVRATVVGENIARGAFAPAEIVAAWRDSPGHHRNLLLAAYRTTGAARAGRMWTAVYAGEAR